MRAATIRLWLLHLVANAVVIGGVYLWLGIGDATGLQLTATAVFGLLLIAFTVWLHGIVFAHFREPELPLSNAYGTALRRLPPLILLTLVVLALYWLLGWLFDQYGYSRSVAVASWLTLHLRRPVRPATILWIATAKLRVWEWLIIPVIFLPIAAGVTERGWRGFGGKSWAMLRHWWFWVLCPVLLLLAIYVPWKLINWVPYQGKLGVEMTSFLLRWLIGWLLFVTAWFALVALACGRRLWRGTSNSGGVQDLHG